LLSLSALVSLVAFVALIPLVTLVALIFLVALIRRAIVTPSRKAACIDVHVGGTCMEEVASHNTGRAVDDTCHDQSTHLLNSLYIEKA
jgi:hypothetical protein